MKILGYLVVGTGEADRYLPKVLEQLNCLCDKIVIGDNAKDEKTKNLLLKGSKNVVYDLSGHEWGREQWKIKQILFNQGVVREDPDWIVAVDSDEVFERRVNRQVLEELAQRGEIAFNFYCVQLWDSENQMRVDGGWGGFRNVRYYQYLKEAPPDFQQTPLHCGLAPVYAYKWAADSEYLFKHYGYLKEEDRTKKAQRYQKYDPEQKYRSPDWYNSILGKPELKPFDEAVFGLKLKYNPRKIPLEKVIKKYQTMKTYYVRNRHGRIWPVNEKIIEEVLRQPGMELIGEQEEMTKDVLEVLRETKSELATPEAPKSFKCDICQKEFDSFKKLRGHKMGKHKI